jgi:hypothetical protein
MQTAEGLATGYRFRESLFTEPSRRYTPRAAGFAGIDFDRQIGRLLQAEGVEVLRVKGCF